MKILQAAKVYRIFFWGVLGAKPLGEWVGRNEVRTQGEASPFLFVFYLQLSLSSWCFLRSSVVRVSGNTLLFAA